jgi:ABC-type branched-subunit amino acid transport system permease subunit
MHWPRLPWPTFLRTPSQIPLDSHAAFYYVALALFALIAWLLWWLIDTPFVACLRGQAERTARSGTAAITSGSSS